MHSSRCLVIFVTLFYQQETDQKRFSMHTVYNGFKVFTAALTSFCVLTDQSYTNSNLLQYTSNSPSNSLFACFLMHAVL